MCACRSVTRRLNWSPIADRHRVQSGRRTVIDPSSCRRVVLCYQKTAIACWHIERWSFTKQQRKGLFVSWIHPEPYVDCKRPDLFVKPCVGFCFGGHRRTAVPSSCRHRRAVVSLSCCHAVDVVVPSSSAVVVPSSCRLAVSVLSCRVMLSSCHHVQ